MTVRKKRKVVAKSDEPRIAIIRTSDRQGFKRCRRRWGLQSGLRRNLDQIERPSYFWIGTGGHFAMEDWHGYNYYGHPVEAFRAYVEGCKRAARRKGARIKLPDDYKEQVTLGEGILENYLIWSKNRDTYKTLWVNGEPQVELKVLLDLTPYLSDEFLNPDAQEPRRDHWTDHWDLVYYQARLDRIVVIEKENWIQDWKFLKSFESDQLELDNQMTAYIWVGNTAIEQSIVGAIKHQFRKELPQPPRILSTGLLSTAEKQKTTHGLYREAIVEIYGNVGKAPSPVINRLNELALHESADRDDFIKRDRTRRSQAEVEAEGTKVLMEIEDMLNPDLPLYPNSTRDCNWDCQMQDVCLMMDRDEDWESYLGEITVSRTEESDEWRKHLPR